MDPSVSALLTVLILNSAIALIVYGLFALVRNRYPKVYNSSSKLSCNTNENVIATSGLDAVFYVKYLETGMYLFIPITILGLAVLMPINAVNQLNLPGLSLLSLSNISDASRVWAHFLVTIAITALALYAVYYRITEYNLLRAEYLKHHSSRTVLIEDIPLDMLESDKLVFMFNATSVEIVRNASSLTKLVQQRQEVVGKLESASYTILTKGQKRITHKPKMFAKPVDSIVTYTDALKEIDLKLVEAQNKIIFDPRTKCSAAFVTFDGPPNAYATLYKKTKYASPRWISATGSQLDVYWPNLGISKASRMVRRIVGFVFVSLLLVFWAIIVAFIGTISTLANLTSLLPFITPVLSLSPIVLGLIQGYLPVVAMAVFMSLLPTYLMMIAKFEGYSSWTVLKSRVQTYFFWFLVINVFLITALSSGIFASIQTIVGNPASALDLLGISIPASSTFFINYVLLQSLVGPALEALQIARLIVQPIMQKFVAKTPRQLALLYQAPDLDFALSYPAHGFILFLGLIFATIAPLVLIPVLFYFFISHKVYKNNLVKVYRVYAETGGYYYVKALRHMVAAIATFQLVVLAIFILKRSFLQAGLLGIPLLATIVFAFVIKPMDDAAMLGEVYEDDSPFVHPNLVARPAKVWINGVSSVSEIQASGVEVTQVAPKILVDGAGKVPDILAVDSEQQQSSHHHSSISDDSIV